jgi:hypothetical protein
VRQLPDLQLNPRAVSPAYRYVDYQPAATLLWRFLNDGDEGGSMPALQEELATNGASAG